MVAIVTLTALAFEPWSRGVVLSLSAVAKDARVAEQWHQMCRVGVGWTAAPADGHCGMQLRHEQLRHMC